MDLLYSMRNGLSLGQHLKNILYLDHRTNITMKSKIFRQLLFMEYSSQKLIKVNVARQPPRSAP